MKTKAAVAFGAGKPLEIVEVDLEGPRAGEVLVKSKPLGFVILMHLHYLVMIRKGHSQLFWDMKVPVL